MYEIEDTDGYFAARGLTVRRCEAWAETNGLALAPLLAAALLHSAHLGSERAAGLLGPRPRYAGRCRSGFQEKVTAFREDLLEAPVTLRSLLRYLDAHGLRDPAGRRCGGKRVRHRRR